MRATIRFIPASAGNTTPRIPSRTSRAVHPRVCGEHHSLPKDAIERGGSSPRLRGTRFSKRERISLRRFIPASAGNTLVSAQTSLPITVHPRVCGEHFDLLSRSKSHAGSSPRLRGTLRGVPRLNDSSRFIPASAGNTRPRGPSPRKGPVHPRVCGEHCSRNIRYKTSIGSSPRLRGTHRCRRARLRWPRFIPASAGNTAAGETGFQTAPVHPRVCGEHIAPGYRLTGTHGSSPRLRGTLHRRCYRSREFRFIPASAGNTTKRP